MELRELQVHVKDLAALERTSAPVVSCYVDIEARRSRNRNPLDEWVRLLERGLSTDALRALEETVGRIDAFLAADLLPQTRGVAVFARAGDHPLFLPLQFRVPLPSYISVDSAPHIYPLVELKDTYHRYVLMFSTEKRVRILAIHLGSIVKDVSSAFPELRQHAGRESTRDHRRDHRQARIDQFIKQQIRNLDRVLKAGGYQHLILAGPPRLTSRINHALPADLAAKLIDIVPASDYDRTKDVVQATLDSFVEREEQESLAKVDRLLQETNRDGIAVSGTRSSLAALQNGQVDVLVLAKGFQPEPGWGCDACKLIEVGLPVPVACPNCGAKHVRKHDLREDLVRLAERTGSEVEIVEHSDALMRLGGVGCLLRFLRPESYRTKVA